MRQQRAIGADEIQNLTKSVNGRLVDLLSNKGTYVCGLSRLHLFKTLLILKARTDRTQFANAMQILNSHCCLTLILMKHITSLSYLVCMSCKISFH